MPRPKHDGCAYFVMAPCRKPGCRPAELCPGGFRVHRDYRGAGHHHKEDDDDHE